MKVVFSPSAVSDFSEILDYLHTRNPAAAFQLVEDLAEFCIEIIGEHPGIGREADHLMPNLRIIAKSNYYICYRVLGSRVEIGRLIHAARDLGRLLREQDPN